MCFKPTYINQCNNIKLHQLDRHIVLNQCQANSSKLVQLYDTRIANYIYAPVISETMLFCGGRDSIFEVLIRFVAIIFINLWSLNIFSSRFMEKLVVSEKYCGARLIMSHGVKT